MEQRYKDFVRALNALVGKTVLEEKCPVDNKWAVSEANYHMQMKGPSRLNMIIEVDFKPSSAQKPA